MGVAPDEQRPVEAVLPAVVDDRLRRGQDVGLVERCAQCGPAVPRGPEGDLLVDVLRVGHQGVVGGDQMGDLSLIHI